MPELKLNPQPDLADKLKELLPNVDIEALLKPYFILNLSVMSPMAIWNLNHRLYSHNQQDIASIKQNIRDVAATDKQQGFVRTEPRDMEIWLRGAEGLAAQLARIRQ